MVCQLSVLDGIKPKALFRRIARVSAEKVVEHRKDIITKSCRGLPLGLELLTTDPDFGSLTEVEGL